MIYAAITLAKYLILQIYKCRPHMNHHSEFAQNARVFLFTNPHAPVRSEAISGRSSVGNMQIQQDKDKGIERNSYQLNELHRNADQLSDSRNISSELHRSASIISQKISHDEIAHVLSQISSYQKPARRL